MNKLQALNKMLGIVLAYGPSRKKKKKSARAKKANAKRKLNA